MLFNPWVALFFPLTAADFRFETRVAFGRQVPESRDGFGQGWDLFAGLQQVLKELSLFTAKPSGLPSR